MKTIEPQISKGLGIIPPFNDGDDPISWNLLNEDISFPALVLSQDQLDLNIAWMQNFANDHNLSLAPHGKTTMCPYLFHKQLRAGAWGITLATASQVKLAHSFRIPRVLMANQLVGKCNMEMISTILKSDPNFEFACLVESSSNVEQLGQFFSQRNLKLRVLLEYGYDGGRTGIRNIKQESDLLIALRKYSECLHPIGVEFYEAMSKTEDDVRSLVQRILGRVEKLWMDRIFTEPLIIISAAGSSWLDIIAQEISDAVRNHLHSHQLPLPLHGILRPGSYLTHEVGTYQGAKERMKQRTNLVCGMKPALSIWAYVQSVPNPNFAILSMGKREVDATFDCAFPIPKMYFRLSQATGTGIIGQFKPYQVPSSWKVTHVMDQHAFLSIVKESVGGFKDDNAQLDVGDIVVFETPYPGTTMDKFRNVVVINKDYDVVHVANTYF